MRVATAALIAAITLTTAHAGATSADRGAWMYAPCDRGVENPAACIEGLMTPYPQDGAGWIEAGIQLSKALVAHTPEFFEVAARHPMQFGAWLRGLGDNTFSTLVEHDSVEAEIQHAYLNRLRELMIQSLSSYSAAGPHKDLAANALERVRQIKVTDL